MGYYTEFILTYKGKTYLTCDRDGFEKYVDVNLTKLVRSYALYKDYIVDMLKFLNLDRSDDMNLWPTWRIHTAIHLDLAGDNMYFITIDDNVSIEPDCIEHMQYVSAQEVQHLKRLPEFTQFLNDRFVLKDIWKKYGIPPDLSTWIQATYF